MRKIMLLLLILIVSAVSAQPPEPTPTGERLPEGFPPPVQPLICNEALPSRLAIGEIARVTPGGPNNVRRDAGTSGELVSEIPGGATFTVLEGPVCASDMAWWRVQYQDITGWTAEGIDGEYWLEPPFVELPVITTANAAALRVQSTTTDPVIESAMLTLTGNHVISRRQSRATIHEAISPFDVENPWREIKKVEEQFHIIHFTSDSRLIVGLIKGTEIVFTLDGNPLTTLPINTTAGVTASAINPDGTLFAIIGMTSPAVDIWDINPGSFFMGRQLTSITLPGENDSVKTILFSPDNQHLITGTGLEFTRWNLQTGAPEMSMLSDNMLMTYRHAISDDSRVFAAAGVPEGTKMNRVNIWVSGERQTIDIEDDRLIEAIALSPDGSLLAMALTGGDMTLWDTATGELLADVPNDDDFAARQLDFDRTGRALIGLDPSTASTRLWSVAE